MPTPIVHLILSVYHCNTPLWPQVRPFRMAPGTMMLQPICIEAQARVCMKAAVAPGSTVGPGKVVGPLSSTHEASFDGAEGDCFAASCRSLLPAPAAHTQLLLGWPLIIACKVRSHPTWSLLPNSGPPAILCHSYMGLLHTCSQCADCRTWIRWHGYPVSGCQSMSSLPVLTPEVCDFNIAVQVFASIPPLLVLAGLLTTLHGEVGAATMSGTLRYVTYAGGSIAV